MQARCYAAHLGYRCRLVAANTAAASRPVKPPTEFPFDASYGRAKRRAHRRRSLFARPSPGPPPSARRRRSVNPTTRWRWPRCAAAHPRGTGPQPRAAGRHVPCKFLPRRAMIQPPPASRRHWGVPRPPLQLRSAALIGRNKHAAEGENGGGRASWRRCHRGARQHGGGLQERQSTRKPSFYTTFRWAKRGAHRRMSPRQPPPLDTRPSAYGRPGGQPGRHPKVAPLRCRPAEGCSAAAAGCRPSLQTQ